MKTGRKGERETESRERDRDEKDNSTQQEGTRGLVCVRTLDTGGRRTPKTKGHASRITVPAVSVDNYAGTFPGSRRNSHGIVNSQEGSGPRTRDRATKRGHCGAPSISRINFAQSWRRQTRCSEAKRLEINLRKDGLVFPSNSFTPAKFTRSSWKAS